MKAKISTYLLKHNLTPTDIQPTEAANSIWGWVVFQDENKDYLECSYEHAITCIRQDLSRTAFLDGAVATVDGL